MREAQARSATPLDIAAVTFICFGWFIFASVIAVMDGFPADGFTDLDFFELIVQEVILSLFALGYLRLRGYPLARLIPVPDAMGTLHGIALLLAAWLVSLVFESAFASAASGAEVVDEIMKGSHVSLGAVIAVSSVNGVYEEVFLLGFLQRAFARSGPHFAVGAALLVRLLYHLYQGPAGAASVVGWGMVLGYYYAKSGKLWPAVFAHIATDIAAFAL